MNTAPPAIATLRFRLLAYSGGRISDLKLDPWLEQEPASLLRVVPVAEAVAGWGPWLVLEESSGEARRLGMNLRAREEGMLRWELTASSRRA